jgi:molybdate transport system substrate-binding protein
MSLPFFSRRAFLFLFLALSSSLMKADDLTVFAAASLTDVLKEIAVGYEKTDGDQIAFNFAASGILEIQIRHGAPADLFFSADEAKMNDLAKDDLLQPGTRRDLLANSLVIVVPADSPVVMSSPAALADPAIRRIALGETHIVPAGIYAEEYLRKIGLWERIAPRVVPLENVRAALAAVETGNVDAGIVYKTDALLSHRVRIAYEVPAAQGPSIVYPAALVKGTKHEEEAAKFLAYLAGPEAGRIFARYGFVPKK